MRSRHVILVSIGAAVAGLWLWGNFPRKPGGGLSLFHGERMRSVPAGYFLMGKDRDDGAKDETPVRKVWVDRFLIGRCEVTNAQYRKFVEETGYRSEGHWHLYGGHERDNHPVVAVTWNDANAYAKWAGGRLPAEAEWEKAARGGSLSEPRPWPLTDVPLWPESSYDFTHKACMRYNRGRGEPPTFPVGSCQPNEYGLYDMVGNVYEWCSDWYGDDYYGRGENKNPRGPDSGSARVFRGGSWASTVWLLRTAHRGRARPDYWALDLGFRIARDGKRQPRNK